MNEELEVLLTIANRLNQNNIAYMISGSMASNYYSIPRMTRDIDIVIELKRTDVERFVKLFEADFWIDRDAINQELVSRGMFNLIHREYFLKADFILHKETDFQKSAFERRKQVVIEHSPIWFIAAEDLILAKLLWAKDSLSELQLRDVKNLLGKEDLDQDYLTKWITQLGLENIYKKARS